MGRVTFRNPNVVIGSMGPDTLDFDQVYASFQPRIRRYLRRLLGSAEADDATQEVFVKVSRALPRFRGDSSLATWIYRIASNAAYDRLRAAAARRPPDGRLDDGGSIGPPTCAADRQLARTEMTDCVRRFIDRLPPNYRAVVVLSEQEGLTNQEVAEALRLTVATVKIRLHRARTWLKKELGDGCAFYRDERNELACEPKAQVAFLRQPPATLSTSR